MKKIIICVALFFSYAVVNAQNNLTVLYKQGKIKNNIDELNNSKTVVKWSGKFNISEFTVKDSVTFFEAVETLEEAEEFNIKQFKKSRKNKILGKNFVPNTIYNDYAKGINLEAIEHKDESYLVKDEISNKQKIWNITEDQKLVFGYACKKAFIVDETGKTEFVVWFNENLKCSLSSNGDYSLPGVILESFDVKTNQLTTAIDLQIETSPIMTPTKGVNVTKAEFIKIKKGKK